jgi:hypothetical protein
MSEKLRYPAGSSAKTGLTNMERPPASVPAARSVARCLMRILRRIATP